jgi:hypothetical protein
MLRAACEALAEQPLLGDLHVRVCRGWNAGIDCGKINP